MVRKALYLLSLLALLLAAGCGSVPTAAPGQETASPTIEAYPPPPTVPTLPPPTPEPTRTPTPTPDLAPQLAVQPVPEDLRAGERIAFLRDGDLCLVRPDGSALAQVTTSGNVTALYGWSYDCSQLLLGVGERPVPAGTGVLGGRDLWVVQANGTDAFPRVQGLEVLEARWSPTDERIAYGTRDGNLYLFDSTGAGHHPLLETNTGFLGSWSPDGTRIAFQRTLAPMDFWTLNLALLDVTTGAIRLPIPEAPEHVDYRPYIWSVNGNQILFQSDRDANGLWWRLDPGQSGLPVQNEGLEQFVVLATGLSRSPVTNQVAFGYYRYATDVPTIWVMDFDGGNLRRLAEGLYPAWSPTGKQIAYAGQEGGLWVIGLDGSGVVQIVPQGEGSLVYEPHWCR